MATTVRNRLVRAVNPPVDVTEPYHRRSFMGFLNAVKTRDNRTLEKVYHTGHTSEPGASIQKAAMAENAGTIGGYLMPQDFTAQLMETFAEESYIYPRATVVPMYSGETLCPVIDATTVQASGTAPWFGGVLFKWGSEQAPAETESTFRQLSLRSWDLLGYAKVSNQWLMDSSEPGAIYTPRETDTAKDAPASPQGQAEAYLLKLFGRAAAWYAEYAFLQGTGSGKQMPLGILSAPGLGTVSRQTSQQINGQDIAFMGGKLLPYGWKHAIWMVHPSGLKSLTQIVNYFINFGPDDGSVGSLLGRPLFVTDKLPALGTKGDLVLFDPSLYVIGDRLQVLVDVSEHNQFQTYQTVFRVWLRMDGKPLLDNAVTLQDTTSTVNGYVALV